MDICLLECLLLWKWDLRSQPPISVFVSHFSHTSYLTMDDIDCVLESIEGELNINTASDFVSQYTIRQEYRFADPSQFESNFASGVYK